MLVKYGAAAG
ncbi:hypothetical protein VCHC55A1_3426, partial [Vibrio cholerae HC-55A1]